MSIKKILLSGTISAFLLGGSLAGAEEIKPKPAIERTLEKKVSKPKIDVIFNYKTESEQKVIDYSIPRTMLWRSSVYPFWRESNVPELSQTEKQEIKEIMKDIKDQDINSYQELLEAGTNLSSENQKLDLASTLSAFLNWKNYILSDEKVPPQEDFFQTIQDSLISNNETPIADCSGISTFTERYLNDLGIKSAAVSGISGTGVSHAYVISKTENGTAIIDYGTILMADTKNIEKTLGAYQKHNGQTTFRHLFFEDAEFKYRLITKDGKHFLDFVQYDESSKPLKNVLVEDFVPQTNLTINLNLEDFSTSVESNLFGFFIKAGQIRGDSSSPLKQIDLIQSGFKRDFSRSKIDIKSELSLIYGGLSQDTELEDNELYGINGNLIISTKQKGLNFSLRSSANKITTKDHVLFQDYSFGIGASYQTLIKNISLEPYVVSQFTFFPKDLGITNSSSRLTELIGGTVFEFKLKDTNVSIDPYYLWRIWEQAFGTNVKIEGENLGIKLEADKTWSTYRFAPDKINLQIAPYLSLKNISIQQSYEMQVTNYDGERDIDYSIGLEGIFNF